MKSQCIVFRLTKILLPLMLYIFIIPIYSFSQDLGEITFSTRCRACHTIGQGKLVGPDLANVQDRLKKDWLIKFIKSSQTLVKSGDAEAVRVFNQFNKIVMPDQPLTNTQILEVLSYIRKNKGQAAPQTATNVPSISAQAGSDPKLSEVDFKIGKKYFTGENRFKNGIPACLSCHHVTNDKIVGGGRLAKDLTKAYSRLSAAGIDALISNPPFPVMKAAFNNKKLTPDEKRYLFSFLKQADLDSVNQHPVNYRESFVLSGTGALVVLFGIFALIWMQRKKECVNREIFKRQIKSN